MKNRIALLILILALAKSYCAFADDSSAVHWGPATNDFLMSIELRNGTREVTNGKPCVLLIRFKNQSKNRAVDVLQMLLKEADATYSFTVLDLSGKDISPIPNREIGGSANVIEIPPRGFRWQLED